MIPKMIHSVQTSPLDSRYQLPTLKQSIWMSNRHLKLMSKIKLLISSPRGWFVFFFFFSLFVCLYLRGHTSFQRHKSKIFYNQFPVHSQILTTININLIFMSHGLSTFSLNTRNKFFTEQPK